MKIEDIVFDKIPSTNGQAFYNANYGRFNLLIHEVTLSNLKRIECELTDSKHRYFGKHFAESVESGKVYLIDKLKEALVKHPIDGDNKVY